MKTKKLWIILVLIVATGLLLPQNLEMPVEGATKSDYHPDSFWYYPWGKSVTHKGVDIFATKGTPVNSSTHGLVVYAGNIEMGGNIVVAMGPKWRIHYYAHLDEISTSTFSWLSKQEQLGTVGDSGNAAGKPPHLHYSILTLVPYLWRIDSDRQGWKKMFVLNPIEYFG